jgi:energy-coupling factor transport system ATP-binding protein
MPPLLEADNITFRFEEDGPPVIDGVSLKLDPGECLMLMGPSGCGKSTMAFILAGLYPEYAGFLEGEVKTPDGPIRALTPNVRARKVSMLFQNPDDQFCMDTVLSEMLFTLENRDFQGDYQAKALELLNLVGLGNFPERPVGELSGGEKQKLSLATALAIEAEILILDEPLANLDPEAAIQLTDVLADRLKNGLTLLVIDHRLDPWAAMVTRLALMDAGGRLLRDDLPAAPFPGREALFNSLGLIPPGGPRFARRRGSASGGISLKAEGLTVRRGGRMVLRDLELALPERSLTAILGGNGSGKTTLFLALAGFLKSKGTVSLSGRVGVVFQNPGLQFLTGSVLGEVLYSLRQEDGKESDNGDAMELRATKLLKDFRLSAKSGQSPWQLSQGEQRRLAVLTMLCGGQAILMLDEPTYSQDEEATIRIMGLLAGRVEAGVSALIATHDEALARAYADRVLTLKAGALHEI